MYEAGTVGEEPKDGPDQFLRVTQTAHWGVAHDSLTTRGQFTCPFLGNEETVLLGEKETWGNRVYANLGRIILREMDGEPLRKVAHTGFGGGIRNRLGERAKSVH